MRQTYCAGEGIATNYNDFITTILNNFLVCIYRPFEEHAPAFESSGFICAFWACCIRRCDAGCVTWPGIDPEVDRECVFYVK